MGLKIRETPIKTYPHQKTFHLWRELYTNNYFTFTECYRPQSSLPESVIYSVGKWPYWDKPKGSSRPVKYS